MSRYYIHNIGEIALDSTEIAIRKTHNVNSATATAARADLGLGSADFLQGLRFPLDFLICR